MGSFICISINEKSQANGNEIYVSSSHHGSHNGSAEEPYDSIQYAIDVADEGDTIYIFGGFYQENLIINKKIKIVGSIDGEETIIDSRFDWRYVIEITADDVTLENVAVSDSDGSTTSPIGALICIKSSNVRIISNHVYNTTSFGIYLDSSSEDNLVSRNIINNAKEGIYVFSSSTNDIANNVISNCSGYAIHVESSPENNRIYGNSISNSYFGIYAQNCDYINVTNNIISFVESHGLFLFQSRNSIMRNNAINNSGGDGVYLASTDCTVDNNTLIGNRRGITVVQSGCEIRNNTIKDNTATGISVLSGTHTNIFYFNKFLNNVQSAQDLGDNQWYNLTLKKGNYWSDYNDVDKNFDGIGDNNYTTGGVFDRYPLGYFLKPPKKPSKPSPSDGKFGVTLQITLQVYVEDPDSNELDVYFYRAADNTLINGITQNPIKVRSKTNAIFKFVLGFHTTFAWYVVVDDGKLQNQSNTWFFATQTSPPDNEPPVADAGGPYAEEIGRTIIFDASDSNDPDGIIDFYRWNFGDGTSEILNKQTTHSYTNSGKYSVTLTVIDNDGSSATNTTIAEIGPSQNKPPVANINGPYEGVYGETILFSGGGSYDPDEEDILQYYWDFGDGTNGTGQSMPHEYSKSGRYVVTLTVTDSNGATDSDSINAEINAAASKKTPGYELIFSIIAILLVLALRRRR